METAVQIPNKEHFKFNEVTSITSIKPYVLRFWESEFEEVAPIISEVGQKLYSKSDISAILKIKKLLLSDNLSIPQARERMRVMASEPAQPTKRTVSVQKVKKSIPQVIKRIDEETTQKLARAKAHLRAALTIIERMRSTEY